MKISHIATVILCLVSTAAFTTGEGTSQPEIIPYKQVGDVELNLHVFTPEQHKPEDKRPAIVFFFGGGWVNWAPAHFYPQAQYLASRGMVAIAAEYRVQSKHGTSPKECVMDGKSAIRWVRAHAEELGIDPDMLAAGGGSAGGHVAAATATVKGFNEAGEDLDVSCVPDALVLFNPVFDNGPGGYGHDRVKAYWETFSPMHNLHSGCPPTVVFLGTQDKLVPVETAETYKKKMEALGRRCDLHLYEGQGHGFFNTRNPEYFTKTLVAADKFLCSLGYLAGEPTLEMKVEELSRPGPD